MTDELKIRTHVKFLNGEIDIQINEGIKTYDAAGLMIASGIVSVGFAVEEDLGLGDVDVTKQGLLYLKNIDATNYVKYGPKSAGVMIEYGRLFPLREAMLYLAPSVVHRWQANVAAVSVRFLCIQETA